MKEVFIYKVFKIINFYIKIINKKVISNNMFHIISGVKIEITN